MHAKSIPHMTAEQQRRFWAKVEVNHPAGCWEWIGQKCRSYGRYDFVVDGKMQRHRAHRIAVHLLLGSIDPTLTVDHLCRNKGCVNPDHLRVVTEGVNVLASYSTSAQNKRKTHCIRGHEFTDANTYRKAGTPNHRYCRICREHDADRRCNDLKRRSIERGVARPGRWKQNRAMDMTAPTAGDAGAVQG